MVPDENSPVQFQHFFKTISVLYLGNYRRRWFMQCSWQSMVNHDWMDPDVSYSPFVLSLLWISWRMIFCIYYYSLGWSLLIYYGSGVPRSLGTPPPYWPCKPSQHWVGFHNWIPNTHLWVFCGLLFFVWIIIIIPNCNGVSDSGQPSSIRDYMG